MVVFGSRPCVKMTATGSKHVEIDDPHQFLDWMESCVPGSSSDHLSGDEISPEFDDEQIGLFFGHDVDYYSDEPPPFLPGMDGEELEDKDLLLLASLSSEDAREAQGQPLALSPSSEDKEDEDGQEVLNEKLEDGQEVLNKKLDHHFEREASPAPKRRRHHMKKSSSLPAQPSRKLKHAANARGLKGWQLYRLMIAGIPLVVINAFLVITMVMPEVNFGADMSEVFSGVGHVALAWQEEGYLCHLFDLERHSLYQDIQGPEGFCTVLAMLFSTRQRGLLHLATVCSTWVSASRGSTHRSPSYPLGDVSMASVRAANTMACRVAILVVVAVAFRILMIHEQPISSIISNTCYFTWARDVIRHIFSGLWARCSTWMGAYGAPTPKPTELLSTTPWVHELKRQMPAQLRGQLAAENEEEGLEMVKQLRCHPDGRKRWCGSKDLKASQAYPVAYGKAVFKQWEMDFKTGQDYQEDSDSDAEIPWDAWQQQAHWCRWDELKFDEVATFLNVSQVKLM